MKKSLIKKTFQSLGTFLITGALTSEAQATAIVKLSEATTQVSTLITGPLGKAVLVFGTIGGVVGAIMKSNLWAAIAIFIIGLVFSFHMDNIAAVFTH